MGKSESFLFCHDFSYSSVCLFHEFLLFLHGYDGLLSTTLTILSIYLSIPSIIFRDIKPDNIGFTKNDQIKIFDFGLAKELRRERYVAPNKYHGSIAGSFRYMSPEMMSGAPYGLPADVYSFAILLWEIIHLKQPFPRSNPKHHRVDVLVWRSRPRIKHGIPHVLKTLLRNSWHHKPHNRPNMNTVHNTIGCYLLSRRQITSMRS